MIVLSKGWQTSCLLTAIVFSPEWCATCRKGMYVVSSETCYLLIVQCGESEVHSHASRLLQLSLSHPDVFWVFRIPFFSNKPLVFSWCTWNTFGWQKLLLFPRHTVAHLEIKFTETSPTLTIAQEGAFFSLSLHRVVSTFPQASVHTVEDIQTDWIWKFLLSFLFVLP